MASLLDREDFPRMEHFPPSDLRDGYGVRIVHRAPPAAFPGVNAGGPNVMIRAIHELELEFLWNARHDMMPAQAKLDRQFA